MIRNWNDPIRVKLTDEGAAWVRAHYTDLFANVGAERRAPLVEQEVRSWLEPSARPLWEVAHIFGPALRHGGRAGSMFVNGLDLDEARP